RTPSSARPRRWSSPTRWKRRRRASSASCSPGNREVHHPMAHALIDLLRETHPDAIASAHSQGGDEVAVVRREKLGEVCRFLTDDPRTDLKLLAQIAGVDLLTYATESTGGGALASIEVPAYDLEHRRPLERPFQVAYNLGSAT